MTFKNDPFALVAKAFEALYPDRKYTAWVYPGFEEQFGEGYGVTNFPDDGGVPDVFLNGDTPYIILVEIFAHELAHVAVGADGGHGAEWEHAFDAILNEYNRILSEMFD